jgi:fatty acid-binding protein DegV
VAKKSDVLCFSFSQKLSATGGQMERVCNDLNGKYGKVYYYNTETATVAQGILVYYALICCKNNKTIEETIFLLDNLKEKLHFYTLLDKDNHFFRGGRCDDLQYKNHIYPLLYLPKGNLYKQVAEFVSVEAGISFIEKKLQKTKNAIVFIGHGNNVDKAYALAKKWQSYAPIVDVCYANPVMGVHTGKNPILVAYLED